MKKILSIDFDYFIKCTSVQRDKYFPQGADEVEPTELAKMWEDKYKQFPLIKNTSVIDDYFYMGEYLKGKKVFVADSHKDIRRVINRVKLGEDIEVINVDFHHDYYHYFGNEQYFYNCGNWLRRLKEDRPSTSIIWVRREDSQIDSLEGEFPFNHSTMLKPILENMDFDFIFICKSPEWTPPHLNELFDDMILLCDKEEL
jgi:hypothetical protein